MVCVNTNDGNNTQVLTRMLCLLPEPPASTLSPEEAIEHSLAIMLERVDRVLGDMAREKQAHKREIDDTGAAGIDSLSPYSRYSKVHTQHVNTTACYIPSHA